MDLTTTLADAGTIGALIPVVAIGGGCLIAIFGVIGTTLVKVTKAKEREQSRREIAAYVAEGTMSPEDGEKLIRATPDEGFEKDIC